MQDADREAFAKWCRNAPGGGLRETLERWIIWCAAASYARQSQEKALALAGAALMDLGRTNARLSAALINIIDCDHHNHCDGPPPRYVNNYY